MHPWAASAGRRTLLPVGLFGGSEKHVFEHAARVHPNYFSYPYSDLDVVTIKLPAGAQATSLPPPGRFDAKTCLYEITADQQDGTLHLNRSLMVNVIMVDPKYYGPLRNFFLNVRNLDEQQVVLSPVPNST